MADPQPIPNRANSERSRVIAAHQSLARQITVRVENFYRMPPEWSDTPQREGLSWISR